MTILAVVAGNVIDPTTFGNAVVDKLNGIVSGKATVTNASGDSPSISFGVTFTAAPVIQVTAVAIGTGQEWTCAVSALSATAFELRTYLNGAAHSGSMTYHWVAIGALA